MTDKTHPFIKPSDSWKEHSWQPGNSRNDIHLSFCYSRMKWKGSFFLLVCQCVSTEWHQTGMYSVTLMNNEETRRHKLQTRDWLLRAPWLRLSASVEKRLQVSSLSYPQVRHWKPWRHIWGRCCCHGARIDLKVTFCMFIYRESVLRMLTTAGNIHGNLSF